MKLLYSSISYCTDKTEAAESEPTSVSTSADTATTSKQAQPTTKKAASPKVSAESDHKGGQKSECKTSSAKGKTKASKPPKKGILLNGAIVNIEEQKNTV